MTAQTIRQRARGLERAFEILEYLRNQRVPRRANEIAIALSAPKSSVYELVGLLVDQGVLEAADDEGRVFLGRRLYFWGQTYIERFDIAQRAAAVLEEITAATGETSQFCMLDGDKYTVVLMNEGSRPFRISADVGARTPIPWTASGRLLLGHLTDEQIMELVPPEDFTLHDGSQIKPGRFIQEVRDATAKGFFSFDSVVDTFTHCFAAPVHDAEGVCVATMCIVAPKDDARRAYDLYRGQLVAASRQLSGVVFG